LDELKNLCKIEHTYHRSVTNFLVNLMAGVVAYFLFPYKPTLPIAQCRTLQQQRLIEVRSTINSVH